MAAITEGIKFLYNQAGELIKWRHEKKQAADKRANATQVPQVMLLPPPPVFAPPSQAGAIDEAALVRLEAPIRDLRKDLSEISDGTVAFDPKDVATLQQVDALRQALEMVLGQRLTFSGEQRPDATGPVVRTEMEIAKVAARAKATNLRIQSMTAGRVEAKTKVGELGPGAEVTSADIGHLGPR
ncbi:MAG TPA: hypothetical protein VGD78_07275 [Chthoniobacterales bacterium]